jgi:hypothetical protein
VGRGAQKGRGHAEVAGDHAVMGASTTGDRGREVGDELTGGVDGTERERERRACERNNGDKPGPRGSERERERGHADWCRQAGPAYQAPRASGRRRAGGGGG